MDGEILKCENDNIFVVRLVERSKCLPLYYLCWVYQKKKAPCQGAGGLTAGEVKQEASRMNVGRQGTLGKEYQVQLCLPQYKRDAEQQRGLGCKIPRRVNLA